MQREQVSREDIEQARLERRRERAEQKQRGLGGAFGFTWIIVELGVFSSLAFSMVLFLAAIAQAFHTIRDAMKHLGELSNAKHLMIAAVEQTDILLVAMALLMISLGMQALFVSRVENVPEWLHIRTFDDLKQKLIGVVVVALAVNFFSVALEWKSGSDILVYGVALSAVIIAVGIYSVILSRLGHHAEPEEDSTEPPATQGGTTHTVVVVPKTDPQPVTTIAPLSMAHAQASPISANSVSATPAPDTSP